MTSKPVLLLPALLISACATKQDPPQPIPALAEQRQCPAFPSAPEALLKPPAKIDFLNPTR